MEEEAGLHGGDLHNALHSEVSVITTRYQCRATGSAGWHC